MPLFQVSMYADGIEVEATDLAAARAHAAEDFKEFEKQWRYGSEPDVDAALEDLPVRYEVELDITLPDNPKDGVYSFVGRRTCTIFAPNETIAVQMAGRQVVDRAKPARAQGSSRAPRKAEEEASESRQTQARDFFERRDWTGLWNFKRTCKKTFKQLGFSVGEEQTIDFYKPDWI